MDQVVAEAAGEAAHHHEHDVAVAVITPVGTYPYLGLLHRLRDGDLPRRRLGNRPQARPALPAGERHLDRPTGRRKRPTGTTSGRGAFGRCVAAGV